MRFSSMERVAFRRVLIATVAAGILGDSADLNAQQIVVSTLDTIPGSPSSCGGDATEVDYWYFTVNSSDVITIDVLSDMWDADSDGVAHYIDSLVFLFVDDGSLDVGDLIATNDDGPLGADGSVGGRYGIPDYTFDSYFEMSVPAGNYVLAITDIRATESDAISGINLNSCTPGVFEVLEEWNFSGCSLDCSFGDYQITFSGDIALRAIDADNDFDGDGISDILWRNTVSGQNWLYQMDGSTIAASTGINSVNVAWAIVGSGDGDGDGKSDILWRNSVTGQNWMYLMDGATISSSLPVNTVANLDWQVASNGDFNGDGKSDILWRNTVSGQNWMYLMDGASIISSVSVNTVPTEWAVVGSGDYDGDGKSDILWRNTVSGRNWLYTMNGATISSSLGINTVANLDWTIVGTGDYDGDTKSDILWRNSATGQNWMYLMDGSAITSSVAVNRVADTNWHVVGDGDYNGDGKADILWRNNATGQNWLYLMNGATVSNSSGINKVASAWQIVNVN